VDGYLAAILLGLLFYVFLTNGAVPSEAIWTKYKDLLLSILPKKFEKSEADGALTITYKMGGNTETLVIKEQAKTTLFTLTCKHSSFGSAEAARAFKPFEIKQADLQDKLLGDLRRQISEEYRGK